MAVPLLHFDHTGFAPMRVGLSHPSIALYGAFHLQLGRIGVQNPTGPVDIPASPLIDLDATGQPSHVSAIDSHGAAIREEFA